MVFGDDIKFLPIDKSVVSESETIKILKFRKSLNGYSTPPLRVESNHWSDRIILPTYDEMINGDISEDDMRTLSITLINASGWKSHIDVNGKIKDFNVGYKFRYVFDSKVKKWLNISDLTGAHIREIIESDGTVSFTPINGYSLNQTEILGALAFHRASNNGDVLKIKISREHWTDRVTLPDGTLMDDRELGDRGIYLEIINSESSL